LKEKEETAAKEQIRTHDLVLDLEKKKIRILKILKKPSDFEWGKASSRILLILCLRTKIL